MKANKKLGAISKPVKKTPLQLIKELRQIIRPAMLEPKRQVEYLMRMTQFGVVLSQLPMEFRHLVVNKDIMKELLESFAALSRHKQCLVCIFQQTVGIVDEPMQRLIREELLPLLEVLLDVNPTDIGLQLSTVGLLRELFKYNPKSLSQIQFDTIVRLLKSIAKTKSVTSKLAEQTLLVLEEPPQPNVDLY